MTRKFEIVPDKYRKNSEDLEITLPTRSTKYSAGYDFYLDKDIEIPKKDDEGNSGKSVYWTDICAQMEKDEVLKIYIRSSMALKKNLHLVNEVGIIDADYYSNEDNHGNIAMAIRNDNPFPVLLTKGEKIAQGIFVKYLTTDDDISETTRNGGIGSTS